MGDNFEENFTKHLDVIKEHFWHPIEYGVKKNVKHNASKKKKGRAAIVIEDTVVTTPRTVAINDTVAIIAAAQVRKSNHGTASHDVQ
jgi:hypothetical protein